ncbi:MAG: hypothetical protein K0R76_1644 [Alphaproteobacteria bacterium]|nr:hypothetical protein [Alphaproteobacteria bacterium]
MRDKFLYLVLINLTFWATLNTCFASQVPDGPIDVPYPSIQNASDNFYTKPLRDSLHLVMERITSKNIALWKNYARAQQDKVKNPGHRLHMLYPGSHYFYKVLSAEPALWYRNEVWVAYVTESHPEPISNLTNVKLYTKNIKMFVTVTSKPDALLTSHMGIAASVEHMSSPTRHSQLSLPLHAFAAQVMLNRNPKRLYMVNAPMIGMEKILEKALPANALHVGTIEDKEYLEQNRKNYLSGRYETQNFKKRGFIRRDEKRERTLYLEAMHKYPPIIRCGEPGKTVPFSCKELEIEGKISAQETRNYEWLGSEPFAAGAQTHYIAVDLKALADAGNDNNADGSADWFELKEKFTTAYHNGDIEELERLKKKLWPKNMGNINDLGGIFMKYSNGLGHWEQLTQDAHQNVHKPEHADARGGNNADESADWFELKEKFTTAYHNGDIEELERLKKKLWPENIGNINDLGGIFMKYSNGLGHWEQLIQDAHQNVYKPKDKEAKR